ncbi:hypothetical protein FRACYDRAFT_237385 [Fragilariopsis cylindrus CCMP1102]|uniref:Uncharacterized protein n=1 Tax=Fragilariopsis cylindrus CCMP1102 TaxID=635003 RepID=A0A1E7FLQ0_9STRA|nr:hypothetical protein FRACYDRAFT_237385 [Fragilariopsis cylindrus CCMP1102]|eukprot:OEU19092.1 hypothetical protein FRACYDRAFT_237385 [Fragilariopsis cylindrus CCMP1102]
MNINNDVIETSSSSLSSLTTLTTSNNNHAAATTIINPDWGLAKKLIDSSAAGYQAVEELQNAIEYVRNDNNWNNNHNDNNNSGGGVTEQQYTYLISSLKECRDQLFLFLKYIEPKEKLNIARLRVENENRQNRIEFGDADDIEDNKNAGVYNPVILPWK